MRKLLLVAALALFFTGAANPAAAHGHGKYSHKKGHYQKRFKKKHYRPGSAYSYNGFYRDHDVHRLHHKRRMHRVYGPGWVPPGHYRKGTPYRTRW